MLVKLKNIYGLLNSLQIETNSKNISTMYVVLTSLGDIITTLQKEEAEQILACQQAIESENTENTEEEV